MFSHRGLLLSASLLANAGFRVANASAREAVCDDESTTLFQTVALNGEIVTSRREREEPNTLEMREDEKAVLVEENQQEAEVRFVRHGNQYSYKMFATSVYTPFATATAWTKNGLVDLKQKNRFFNSREPGMWAQATVHEDGTVSGLFEDQGRIMRISKSEHRFFKPPQVRTRADVKEPEFHHYHENESDPHIAEVDTYDHGMPHVPYEGETSNKPLPSTKSWNGELFYPDCYAGDSEMHDLVIGVTADTKAKSEGGSGLQGSMEQAVAEASFIFEHQMNIRIVIDNLHIYETNNSLSGYELAMNDDTCVDSDSAGAEGFMAHKLDDLRDFLKYQPSRFQSTTHLFTGCGKGVGVIGYAWRGWLCDAGGYGSGVNQMIGDDTFLTFAHELGHNIGMYHPFSEGKEDSTGGIMDYGDGLLNGYYQFNREYRRAEACPVLSSKVNQCSGKFQLHQDPNTASGSGDPHLVNLRGEKFDLNVAGDHLLLQIPKGSGEELEVIGSVEHFPSQTLESRCDQFLFKKFTVRGNYVDARKGEIVIDAGKSLELAGFAAKHQQRGKTTLLSYESLVNRSTPAVAGNVQMWGCKEDNSKAQKSLCKQLGSLAGAGHRQLKVFTRKASTFVMKLPGSDSLPLHLAFSRFEGASPAYLNLGLHGLASTEDVGGLLGSDDHSEVSKPVAACNFTHHSKHREDAHHLSEVHLNDAKTKREHQTASRLKRLKY